MDLKPVTSKIIRPKRCPECGTLRVGIKRVCAAGMVWSCVNFHYWQEEVVSVERAMWLNFSDVTRANEKKQAQSVSMAQTKAKGI